MFNVNWQIINNKPLQRFPGNGRCGIDIVGNQNFPGLFTARDNEFVYFRMRLRCNPLDNQGDELENSVWGILIKNAQGNPLFTVRVNGKKGANEPPVAVQVYVANANNPFVGMPVCTSPLVLGTNVIVSAADSNLFGSQNYFLDFKIPLSCFPENFFNQSLIYCGFTSRNSNNINQETPQPYGNTDPNLCGDAIRPPVEKVRIEKTVTPNTVDCNTPTDFNVEIKVTNISGQALTGVTITDNILPPFVTGDPTIHTFPNQNFSTGETKTFNYTVNGFYTTSGTHKFNRVTATIGDAVIGNLEGPNVTVRPCRGVYIL